MPFCTKISTLRACRAAHGSSTLSPTVPYRYYRLSIVNCHQCLVLHLLCVPGSFMSVKSSICRTDYLSVTRLISKLNHIYIYIFRMFYILRDGI